MFGQKKSIHQTMLTAVVEQFAFSAVNVATVFLSQALREIHKYTLILNI